jgi:outer membrane phospholipase A
MRAWQVTVVSIWLLVGGLLEAAQLETILKPPEAPAQAGRAAVITLFFANSGAQPAHVDLGALGSGRLSREEAQQAVAIRYLEPPETPLVIPPAGFRKIAAEVALPDGWSGMVSLTIDGLGGPPLVFPVQEAAQSPTAEPQGAPAPPPCPPPNTDLGYFWDNFSGHEPIYFLYGPNPADVKFQVGFKYHILNSDGPIVNRWPLLDGLHLGYTQTSFWDLETASQPFDDTSYRPEIFLLHADLRQRWLPQASRLDFQAGLQHQSNGQGGDANRSLNIAYAQPTWTFGDPQHHAFTVAPRVFAYLSRASENNDIENYRGYSELLLKLGRWDGVELATTLRKGTRAGKGSWQMDFSTPIGELLFDNLDLFFHAQFFTGYSESLLRYDESDTRLRLGFSFYR